MAYFRALIPAFRPQRTQKYNEYPHLEYYIPEVIIETSYTLTATPFVDNSNENSSHLPPEVRIFTASTNATSVNRSFRTIWYSPQSTL